MWIYLNGEFVPKNEAKVSVFDHGFLYGDGIFEGIRCYQGNVFRLDDHLKRLYESALSIMLEIPLSYEEMKEAVLETVRKNRLQDAYIRLIVSRGEGDLGLDPRSCPQAQVIIIAGQIKLYPQELYDNGMEVVTIPTRRNVPDALNPKIKSLNYLNNILAKIEATRAGVMEALMLNTEGYVCECTGDNIFIVKNGRVITPPTYLGALDGITRRVIMDICRDQGIECAEEPFTRHDVFVADECFLTGTAAEVIPVTKLDGRKIGTGMPGPLTKQLIAEFRKRVTVEGTPVYP
ncbi:MAG: branched-chain amino acid aminotransferase [Bacillus thermozeamaize]|jgi:branched-chain amino acid aminotransferase|uniref:Branched-chain-amino-acid aminotransferase n=1 Tax=Bacillus thermozeamaize TaxID=230954 RepID=A0A1Y3PHZ2_9BACI|nr:MAG: branched-chain amino acid aminotransferase [Bacillus thermozeamaize]